MRKEPGKIIKGGKGEDDNKHRRENERQGIWWECQYVWNRHPEEEKQVNGAEDILKEKVTENLLKF